MPLLRRALARSLQSQLPSNLCRPPVRDGWATDRALPPVDVLPPVSRPVPVSSHEGQSAGLGQCRLLGAQWLTVLPQRRRYGRVQKQ